MLKIRVARFLLTRGNQIFKFWPEKNQSGNSAKNCLAASPLVTFLWIGWQQWGSLPGSSLALFNLPDSHWPPEQSGQPMSFTRRCCQSWAQGVDKPVFETF